MFEYAVLSIVSDNVTLQMTGQFSYIYTYIYIPFYRSLLYFLPK